MLAVSKESTFCWNSVRVKPGQTQSTWTPVPRSSAASDVEHALRTAADLVLLNPEWTAGSATRAAATVS